MATAAEAQAKINTFLAVGPRQADGYHQLVTVYHSLNIIEQVRLSRAPDGVDCLTFDGPIDSTDLDTGSDNLVWRAVDLVAATLTTSRPPLHISVTKNIPIQGGMAGGSADAAAALRAANVELGAGLSDVQLGALAVRLGSDVPFVLAGGNAIGTGRGERLEPLAASPLWWVMVFDTDGLSTPVVYAKLDEMRAERGSGIGGTPGEGDGGEARLGDGVRLMGEAMAAGDARSVATLMRNDLQQAALALAPRLADTLAAGRAAGALAGIVSGSGPTVALLVEGEDEARSVAARMRASGRNASVARGG